MISHEINPSLIRHNPSRKCDGFTHDHMENPSRNGESVHDVSRAAVTDFRGRKSIYSKYIYLSFLYTSRCHAHARALRVRTREGVCDVFGRRIGPARPIQQRLMLRPCSHTLANVGQCGVVAPRVPSPYPTQRVATRWPTCDLPVWQTNRYLAKDGKEDWPVGTGPDHRTVCFTCPTFANA